MSASGPSGPLVCVWSVFCYEVLSVLSSFTIVSLRKRELVALFDLSSCWHLAVSDLYLLFAVQWRSQNTEKVTYIKGRLLD